MGLISKLAFVATLGFVVGGVGFFLIGWFTGAEDFHCPPKVLSPEERLMLELLQDNWIEFDVNEDINEIKIENIRNHLIELTKIPHLAGLARDVELANYIKTQWESYGFDEVNFNDYEVLLSYPDPAQPNLIKIYDSSGVPILTTKFREDLGDGTTLDDNFVDAYLAYSPTGSYQGSIVYVNYGMVEDFSLLTNSSSPYFVDLSDKICMMRFGQIYRGNKVFNAHLNGCKAAILYSDPYDVAGNGTANVYPDSFWLPGTGMQRGNIKPGVRGDPETPFWPSIPNVYRLKDEDLDEALPKIPAQCIGYDDAIVIFSKLEMIDPPESWKGSEEVPYTIGGKFSSECPNCTAEISVNTFLETKNSTNVIGIIRGEIEPDRYVLVGNHRDALGYGAIDPSSATAHLMEVARILGEKKKFSAWKPRRSIVFLSWGAEEFGLIGSTEFNQDFSAKLSERSVLYFNSDFCMSGPIFIPAATPSLRHKAYDLAKNVANPWNSSETYYDFWSRWNQEGGRSPEPFVTLPASATDHDAFIFLNGIPTFDIMFISDANKYEALRRNLYPTYHTAFETFKLMDEILDPGFKIHDICSQMSLRIIRELSDSILLDFRPEEYGKFMQGAIQLLNNSMVLQQLESLGIETEFWIESIDIFANATLDWRERVNSVNASENPMLARILNDQMMKLDRTFLLPSGLPSRPNYKHAIISPSIFSGYGPSVFPGIVDLLHALGLASDTDEQNEIIEELKMHISDLLIVTKQATDFIKDVSMIF